MANTLGLFDREIADLVTRPVDDGLAPRPYSTKQADQRFDGMTADGYRRYQAGAFAVEVSPWGLLQVHERDWLSKFAQAIHGDTQVAGRFARILGDDLIPIADERLIETEEILVHVPTFRARQGEEKGLSLMVNGKEVPVPRPDKGRQSAQDFIEREARRREAEMGAAGDASAQRMQDGSFDDAMKNNSLPGFLKDAVAGTLKSVGIQFVRQTLQEWLAVHPNLEWMAEEEKEFHFLNDGVMATKILTHEFLTGSGPALRQFDERHALTATVRGGQIGTAIALELGDKLNAVSARRGMHEGGPLVLEDLSLPAYPGNYAFSPDHTMAEQGALAGTAASLQAHLAAAYRFGHDEPVEFFIGGCTYTVDPGDRQLGADGMGYAVVVTNTTSLTSLFTHSPQVKNVDRDDGLQTALQEVARALPYSSIKQEFHFFLVPQYR